MKKDSVNIPKKRESNIELLRIISMLMIIASHYAHHGGFKLDNADLSVNVLFLQGLEFCGKIGVNLFVLISGYFLVNSSFKFSKLRALIFQVWTYSVLIFGFTYIFSIISPDKEDYFKAFFPICYNQYWFATSYILLYISVPVINKVIKAVDRVTLLKIIGVLLLFESVIPTLTGTKMDNSFLLWFVTLYCIAAYVRLYPSDFTCKTGKSLLAAAVFFALLLISAAAYYKFGSEKLAFMHGNPIYYRDMFKLPLALCSVFMFIGFKNLKVKYSAVINWLASSVFGVYLLHDNNYIREWLWMHINNVRFLNSNKLIIHCVLVVLAIFIIGTVTEHLREFITKHTVYKISAPIWIKIEKKISKSKVIKDLIKKI